MKRSDAPFWSIAALVVALFFCSAGFGGSEWGGTDPGRLYYNLLVRGFQAGKLSLEAAVPPGLAALPDPYDPAANAPYRFAPYFLQDTSFYQGRLYLYFGITPALVLFWPWAAATGSYLAHKYAVAIFCSLGYLVAAGLFRSVWKRYFPQTSAGVAAALVGALGLVPSLLLLLERPGICEVPIACAYLFVFLALAGVWGALHRPDRAGRWLLAASAAYGLAVGARPSDLFGAVVLAIPVWRARREGRAARLALAAIAPLAVCGLGIAGYNALRFGSPFDFGHAYQLSDIEHAPGFVLGSFVYNLRFYFFAPAYLTSVFPFVQGIRIPALPPGYYHPDGVFGLLPNLPFVLLALASPLALRRRTEGDRANLRDGLVAVGLLGGTILGLLLFYFAACGRYEAEYLPFLVFLAAVGVLGLERATAGRTRFAIRVGWIALLAISVAFNVLGTFGRYAADRYTDGQVLARAGRLHEAEAKFAAVLRADPGYVQARLALAEIELRTGRSQAALDQYRRAAEQMPDSAIVRLLTGDAYLMLGRAPEAAASYREALRLEPGDATIQARLELAGRLMAR